MLYTLVTTPKRIIYGLVDPRDGLIHYVGRSSSGLARPRAHRAQKSLRTASQKNTWLRDLFEAGLDYSIATLDVVAPSEALLCWWWPYHTNHMNDAERWWIAYGRASGWPLTNMTDGGEGNGIRRSDLTRARISACARSRTPEHRAKLGAAHRGKKLKPEHIARISGDNSASKRPDVRAKMSAAHKGRPYHGKQGYRHTEETKQKIREAITGLVRSTETRERVRAAKLGKPLSLEHRQKIGLALRGNSNAKGRTLTEEHRLKISASLRGRGRSHD